MISPEEAALEAEKAGVAFQVALAKIGIATIAEAIKLWRRMPANKAAEMADDWLKEAVFMVMSRRSMSRDLASAYYRLARALRTGTTVPDPYNPIPTHVTLGELRREFAQLTASVSQPSESPSGATGGATPTSDPQDGPEPSDGDSEVIPIDPIEGVGEDGDAEDARLDREAEQEARIVLVAMGPNALKKRVDAIDHKRPAEEVDVLRDDAHSAVGARQAAAIDRMVKNGARDKIRSTGKRDKKVIGWVRVSRTGTPCGWCAMLISRGVIFYSSKRTAELTELGDQYHDNCNCYAEPVYSMSQYESDSRFDLNREYSELWPVVTRGLSGKEALSAWRRYFRKSGKAGDSDTGRAQAA